MVIENQEVLDYVETLHYKKELFLEYIEYQKENKDKYLGKWTIEEYGAAQEKAENPVDIQDISFQEWFSDWNGWGSAKDIPSYCSFEQYCIEKNVNAYVACYSPFKESGFVILDSDK